MSHTYPYAVAAAFALLIGGVGTTAARADGAPATDLYVDGASQQCLDSGPGTAAEPFCTLQAAADAVGQGDTVHVTATTMPYQPFTISRSGTAAQPIQFVYAPAPSGFGPTEVEVQSPTSTAITVSGAQYVSFSGFDAYGLGQTALSLTGAAHIGFDSGMLVSTHTGTATTTQPNTVEIDGTSSAVTLSKDQVPQSSGWGVDAQPGASDIVATDDYFHPAQGLGGIHADGVNGIVVTADSIRTNCGSAVDIEGDSSGSIENVVAQGAGSTPDTGSVLCANEGPAAEINVSAQAAPHVVSDYNAVQAGDYGVDYQWAGNPYTTSQAFNQGSTQGAHDLDTPSLDDATGLLKEGSVLIDSGDADAPDQPATDLYNRPRTDDPLVANTGTGDGYVDRGAFEFQNPFTLTEAAETPVQGPGPLPVTASADVVNPWNTQGVLYSFSFGDGSPASTPSASITADHTYAAVTTSTQYYINATAQLPDGSTRHGQYNSVVTVNPQAPLVPVIDAATAADQPDSAMLTFSATDPWTVTGSVVDFGDTSHTLQFAGSAQALWHPFPAPGTYTVTDTVTDQGGNTVTVSKQVTVGLSFTGIIPQRVLDTRYGTGAPKAPVGPGGMVRVKITGVDGIPSTGVSAVTMNVTDTHATASSWITAYADGTPRPNTSNLNFGAGQTNPNLITVPVGSDGYADLWNANGKVDLFADVQGYYTDYASDTFTSDTFAPTTPTRVLDTRYGTGAPKAPVGPGSVTTVTLPAASAQADDAVLNITETGATAGSWVTVYPGTGGMPNSSSLNFGPGQTTSNLVVVPLSSTGPKTIRIYNSAGRVNLFADVQGYYDNLPQTSPYIPVTPTRVVDTRYGTGAPKAPIGPGGTLRIKVTGVQGVPQGTAAVLLNLTGTRATASTWLTAYANGATPSTSNIDLVPDQTRPVLAVVPVDPDGYITIANARGTTDVFADLEGYFG